MFKQACAFADCAKFCEVEHNIIIESRFHSHTVAGIVNSAFACEVYIKTLLVFHGVSRKEMRGKKKSNGHDLNFLWELYKKKDNDSALLIEQRIKKEFNSSNEGLFGDLLGKCSNAFNYWRYIYEKNSGDINIHFLRIFRLLLRNLCCEKLYGKTWKEYVKEDTDTNKH